MHLTMHCRVTLQYKAAVQLHALIAPPLMHLTMHCRVTLQFKAAVQLHALIAQLVERLICNQDVPSSNLGGGTIIRNHAGVLEW